MTSTKKSWLKSGSYSFLGKLSAIFFNFLNFLILIRLLSKEDFGMWVLFLSITAILETTRNAFIHTPLVKYLIGAKKEEFNTIIGASFYLNLIMAIFTALILAFFSAHISILLKSPELTSLFYTYIFIALAITPLIHSNFIQQANLDFKGTFYSATARASILFFYIFKCYYFKQNIELINLVFVQCAAVVVGALISYYFAKECFSFNLNVNWHWIKKLFHYGKYTFGTNISSMLFKSIDSWMLGSLFSPGAVAVYNPAIRVSSLFEVPVGTISSVLLPQAAKRVATEGNKAAKYLYERSVGVIMAFMAPAILFILYFSEEIVFLIAGSKYAESVPILQVTVIYGLIIPFNRQFGVILNVIGKANINFYVLLVTTLLNIVYNYFFIINFGIIGAAYGTLAAYLTTWIISEIILYKILKVKIKNIVIYTLIMYRECFEFLLNRLKIFR